MRDLPVFTPGAVAQRLRLGPSSAQQLLHRAARKGLVERLERGKYAAPRELLAVASHLAPVAYLSFWTGLSLHGLSLQVPRTVQLAVARQRRGLVIHGTPIRFVTLGPRCFGYHQWPDGSRVALPEKALVDALYLPRLAGGLTEINQALERGLREGTLQPGRLARLALAMDSASLCRRLGYLLDLADAPPAPSLRRRLAAAGKGYALLEPGGPRHGPRDHRWRLRLNRRLRPDRPPEEEGAPA